MESVEIPQVEIPVVEIPLVSELLLTEKIRYEQIIHALELKNAKAEDERDLLSKEAEHSKYLHSLKTQTSVSKMQYNSFRRFIIWLFRLNTDLIIYGGCPRDLINREHNVNLYHKYCGDNNRDYEERYNDKTFHPETFIGRNRMPKDIDTFMSSKDFEIVMAALTENYVVKKLDVSEPYFKQNLDNSDLKYIRLHISSKLLPKDIFYNLRTFVGGKAIKDCGTNIYLDIIINQQPFNNRLSPPFNNADFNINLISMNSELFGDGIYNFNLLPIAIGSSFYTHSNITKRKALLNHKFDETVSDIQNMIAIIDNLEIPIHRLIKMVSKGYTIKYDHRIPDNIIPSQSIPNTITSKPIHHTNGLITYEDVVDEAICVICRDVFKLNEIGLMPCHTGEYTGECRCQALFHERCYISMRGRNDILNCPLCRSSILDIFCHCKFINFKLKLEFVKANIDSLTENRGIIHHDELSNIPHYQPFECGICDRTHT